MKLILNRALLGHIALCITSLLCFGGCSSSAPEAASLTFHDSTQLPSTTEDVMGDANSSNDGGQSAQDMGQPSDGDALETDVVQEPELGGETIGDAIAFAQEDLDRVFLFGLGVEPGSSMGMIGNTAAGVLAMPAALVPNDGQMEIRVYDWNQGATLDGSDNLIESYPYTVMDDGRYLVDFSSPGEALEVQIWDSCRYVSSSFNLVDVPVYKDGLVTWPAVERFEPEFCGFNVPPTEGVNVHFLRVMNQDSDFVPRAVDPDQPFGFFEVEHDGQRILSRLPKIGEQYEDGSVVYYIVDEIPYNLRPVIKDIFTYWNDTLEETIGQRPFLLSDTPSPAVVPWDPRFRVVSFNMDQPLGAIAPFISDPITGEMFETDVLIWLGDVGYIFDSYNDVLDDFPELYPKDDPPGGADFAPIMPPFDGQRARPTDPSRVPAKVLKRTIFDRIKGNEHIAKAIPETIALNLTSDELLRFVIADFVIHELGHNLGLRHNFIGSADRSKYEFNQSSSSVMDYVIGMPRPGQYDEDAMRYGYGDGALTDDYLYCTDEGVPFNPACTRWDFGHPVKHLIEELQRIRDDLDPGYPDNAVNNMAEQMEWNDLFRKMRLFINSGYEYWDVDEPVFALDFFLSEVVCNDDCTTHMWLRKEWAKYPLYTKFNVYGDWYPFPDLSEEQAAQVFATYFDLIKNPAQPFSLKQTIIEKLPTANVEGASNFLQEMKIYFSTIESPSQEEQQILDVIESVD